jgi:hypothetical protein
MQEWVEAYAKGTISKRGDVGKQEQASSAKGRCSRRHDKQEEAREGREAGEAREGAYRGMYVDGQHWLSHVPK